jgi:pimeloyl-ACP methyl ester carboxylesterase
MATDLLDVGGQRLKVVRSGPENGTPVWMLHGNPDTHRTWDRVVKGLERSKHTWRVIRPDMPGFGASAEPPPTFDYRPGATVPLWNAFYDAMGHTEPILVVVHDFGGPWLLPWVARNREKVRGLVICSAPFHPSFRWHFWGRIWQTLGLGELSARLTTRALTRFEMRRGSKGLPVSYCDQAFDDMHPVMQRSVLRTYRSHADPIACFAEEHPRLMAALADLPTRTIWGDLDPYLPLDQGRVFNAPLEVVPDAGHWTPVEAPEKVVWAMDQVEDRYGALVGSGTQ